MIVELVMFGFIIVLFDEVEILVVDCSKLSL